jgi:hypothetical protein
LAKVEGPGGENASNNAFWFKYPVEPPVSGNAPEYAVEDKVTFERVSFPIHNIVLKPS